LEGKNLFTNELVLLRDEQDEKVSLLGRFRGEGSVVIPIQNNGQDLYGIRAKNLEQSMAAELLLNNDIRLVTLLGQAGTGKTLLAVAAALRKVVDENAYRRLLISRPIMPLGRDIGYLPGTKEEKVFQWMQPIFDNMEYILDQHRGNSQDLKALIDSGVIQMEAVTYMRGRSLAKQFIIIDEAQNLTPHEIKAIITRVGPGSKMVLTGDPFQIDNPFLDSASNGLTYAVEKLKGQSMFGNMFLVKSERSDIASIAAELL